MHESSMLNHELNCTVLLGYKITLAPSVPKNDVRNTRFIVLGGPRNTTAGFTSFAQISRSVF